MSYFGLSTSGDNVSCEGQQPFPNGGTAGLLSTYFDQGWSEYGTCIPVTYQTGYSLFVHDGYKTCVSHYYPAMQEAEFTQ